MSEVSLPRAPWPTSALDFVRRHPFLFLLLTPMATAMGDGSGTTLDARCRRLREVRRRHATDAAYIIVGRDRLADVHIGDSRVSRNHCAIDDSGALTLCDLGSKNRTLVNGKPLVPHRPHPLHPHDRLNLGGVEVLVLPPSAAFLYLCGQDIGR